jgi:hypothetical protein
MLVGAGNELLAPLMFGNPPLPTLKVGPAPPFVMVIGLTPPTVILASAGILLFTGIDPAVLPPVGTLPPKLSEGAFGIYWTVPPVLGAEMTLFYCWSTALARENTGTFGELKVSLESTGEGMAVGAFRGS